MAAKKSGKKKLTPRQHAFVKNLAEARVKKTHSSQPATKQSIPTTALTKHSNRFKVKFRRSWIK